MFRLTARVLLTVVIATTLWLSLYEKLDDERPPARDLLVEQRLIETVVRLPPRQSPLPTPTPIYPLSLQDTVLYALDNGDVVLYDLRRGRELILAEEIYFVPWDSEAPHHYLLSSPLRVSPDGRWLLIPTPDRGTWLVDLYGGEPRQVSAIRLPATWSPDSRRIAFWQSVPPAASAVYVQEVVASDGAQALLQDGLGYPTWTPGCQENTRGDAGCDQLIMGIHSFPDTAALRWEAWLVDAHTGSVRSLGPATLPPMEVVPANFRWSPDGDEAWIVSSRVFGSTYTAYPIDGSGPRPMVTVCSGECAKARGNERKTSGGWLVRQEFGRPEAISVVSPQGETARIAEGVFFMGVGEQLKATEVGQAVELEALPPPGPPDQWTRHAVRNAALQFSVPPQWRYEDYTLANFEIHGDAGQAALTDEHLQVSIEVTFRGDDYRQVEVDQYAVLYYGVISETVMVGGRSAVRTWSELDPTGEQIAIALPPYEIVIRRSPRTSKQDGFFDQFLASITLPAAGTEAVCGLPGTVRSGPGAGHSQVGQVDIGDVLSVVGRNEAGDWMQLNDGSWVEARAISKGPRDLPVVAETSLLPTPTAVADSPMATP